jgi:hypothetical protein
MSFQEKETQMSMFPKDQALQEVLAQLSESDQYTPAPPDQAQIARMIALRAKEIEEQQNS